MNSRSEQSSGSGRRALVAQKNEICGLVLHRILKTAKLFSGTVLCLHLAALLLSTKQTPSSSLSVSVTMLATDLLCPQHPQFQRTGFSSSPMELLLIQLPQLSVREKAMHH